MKLDDIKLSMKIDSEAPAFASVSIKAEGAVNRPFHPISATFRKIRHGDKIRFIKESKLQAYMREKNGWFGVNRHFIVTQKT